MKKKIKDLTFDEMATICEKHNCKKCPLYPHEYYPCCYFNAYKLITGSLLKEQEVEIDE